MAQVARRSTPASLRRMAPERRYPLLAAAVTEAYRDITDEIVVMFDQGLSTLERRIRRLIRDDQVASADADRDRLDLLDAIIDVALNPALDDIAVGRWIRGLGSKRLIAVQRPPTERGRARDSGLLGYLKARYSHVRASAPYVVAALKFHASVKPSVVLEATKILQHLNATSRRNVPPDAPTEFVPARWQPYLSQATADSDHTAFRHYWELALLYALRNSLRSGEIWVEGSRRYADPATYLLTDEEWHKARAETLSDSGRASTFAEQLQPIDADTTRLLNDLEDMLRDPNSPVRLDSESRLRLQRLTAEHVDPAATQIGQDLAAAASIRTAIRTAHRGRPGQRVHQLPNPRRRRSTKAPHPRTPAKPLRGDLRPSMQLRNRPHGRTVRNQPRHHRMDHPLVSTRRHPPGG